MFLLYFLDTCINLVKYLQNVPLDVSITGASQLQKNNQGRPPNLPVPQKRNILQQIKRLEEEMGNFFCKKRVMVKVGIPPSISEERIRRLLQKTDLK